MEPARVQRSATRAIGPDSSGQGSLPHAGGAEALYLSTNSSASPIAIETQLKSDAVAASTKSRDGTAIKRPWSPLVVAIFRPSQSSWRLKFVMGEITHNEGPPKRIGSPGSP